MKMGTRMAILSQIFVIFATLSQQGDCPAMCVTEGNTYTAVNGSIDNELNAANRGCLVANEATSSFWFRITFTSNGVFYMTITPSGNKNDFDFAVWSGTNCPPTAAPIRCSFAGIFPFGGASNSPTGLAAGNTDTSESPSGNGWVAPLNVTAGQSIVININNYGNGSNDFVVTYAGTTAGMYCPIALGEEDWTMEGVSHGSYIEILGKTDKQAALRVNGEVRMYVDGAYSILDTPSQKTLYELVTMDGHVVRSVTMDTKGTPDVVRCTDMSGRDVPINTEGLKIIHYSDGTVKIVM